MPLRIAESPYAMKTLGIVGGIAPESTIDYYRSLIASYRARSGSEAYPSIVINSIDLNRVLGLVSEGRLAELTDLLVEAVVRLQAAGADVGLLASNTPHIVFCELNSRSPMPMLSIVESVAREASRLGMTRVGLFGTRFTMEAGFYRKSLGRSGIEVVLPTPEEREYIHDRYIAELIAGQFLDSTRSRMTDIANRLHADESIEGLILGGTELPLLLRNASEIKATLLDSTSLHVKDAVTALISEDGT